MEVGIRGDVLLKKSRIRLQRDRGDGMVSAVQRTAGRLQVWFYKPDTPSCLA